MLEQALRYACWRAEMCAAKSAPKKDQPIYYQGESSAREGSRDWGREYDVVVRAAWLLQAAAFKQAVECGRVGRDCCFGISREYWCDAKPATCAAEPARSKCICRRLCTRGEEEKRRRPEVPSWPARLSVRYHLRPRRSADLDRALARDGPCPSVCCTIITPGTTTSLCDRP